MENKETIVLAFLLGVALGIALRLMWDQWTKHRGPQGGPQEAEEARPGLTSLSVGLNNLVLYYMQRDLSPNEVSDKDYKDLSDDLETINDLMEELDLLKVEMCVAMANHDGRRAFYAAGVDTSLIPKKPRND